ncbi:hypothetical protein LSTR_LSTR009719 [Laodelphax striatellus]|uniref:Uncharacterized protein n=1 Tax=Laodelphax striatellus TaxID=195883 RepID=A0A482WVZ3_LAOST|nr:hypothetical protein LSTR_LSTR009719 [Laodelphax striatellus]
MKFLFQNRNFSKGQNRALDFFRVASVLLIGTKTQPCCGLCLPDLCALPSCPPSSGYPCCPPSYCVQNVVVGSQDKDKTNNNDDQPTNDQCYSYPQDCSTYCCRQPRACCQEDPTILRRLLASLQQQQCCRRRSYVDPCCCSSGSRSSSFSDPGLSFSSSGSFSDPGAFISSGGFGSFSESSTGSSLSSALRSILDPSYSSSGLISVSDPSSLLSSSALRSSLLLDPYILSQISDPQTSYYDPPSSSSYSYDPCCNTNPCATTCNPCCNPCCRVVRQQPCCKRTQRRVILIDNVTPETCFV